MPKTPNPFEKQFFKLCVTSFLKWLAGGVCLLLAFMPLPKWVRAICSIRGVHGLGLGWRCRPFCADFNAFAAITTVLHRILCVLAIGLRCGIGLFALQAINVVSLHQVVDQDHPPRRHLLRHPQEAHFLRHGVGLRLQGEQ